MKVQQQMHSCLKEWKDISGLDFCLIDHENNVTTATSESFSFPDPQLLEDFRFEGPLFKSEGALQLRKIRSELSVPGKIDNKRNFLSEVEP